MARTKHTIDVGDGAVSALLDRPESEPRFAYVFAHGAGAGMDHPFMTRLAESLLERGIATLRYQFPYVERGQRRVDPPEVAQRAVRAAAGYAVQRLPGVPLVAGGKSFGGRMTSQAQAAEPLAGVRGLAFVGFPLHPPDKPGIERAAHLANVHVPMLFLQGTRDEFARLDLLEPVVRDLGARATLRLLEDGNHSFAVRKGLTGMSEADVFRWLVDAIVDWRP